MKYVLGDYVLLDGYPGEIVGIIPSEDPLYSNIEVFVFAYEEIHAIREDSRYLKSINRDQVTVTIKRDTHIQLLKDAAKLKSIEDIIKCNDYEIY